MDRIYRFDEFTLVLESTENNNEELLRAIEKVAPRKNFVRWATSPNFHGVYTRPSEEYPGFEKIICKWGDKEFVMSKILYRNGDFYSIYDIMEKIKSGDPFYFKHVDGIFKLGDPDYFDYAHYYFNIWLGDMVSFKKEKEINPFEYGVENMPIIKEFESGGMKIVSNARDKMEGRLVLRFPDPIYDYIITPEGDVYRKKDSNEISFDCDYYDDDYDDIKEEFLKGIYKLDDLVPKIKFVYMLYILDIIENKKFPKEVFKELLSILDNNKEFDPSLYKKEYDKIVKEYPQMALYLLKPKGEEYEELVKGAKILGRMGIF